MALSSGKFSDMERLIRLQGLEAAWKGVLLARVLASGREFAYINFSQSFWKIEKGPDLLMHLSIGEISVLYEYALAYHNRAKRKIEGQYFTPDDISQFLAKHSKDFPASTVWVDPCSGVGNLSYWLVKEQLNPENFLLNRLYLIDKDPLALLSAQVLFTLAFQNKETNLFEAISSRFLVRDFLEAEDLPKVDAAILNPPYVSGIMKSEFETASTRNLYAYFLERVSQMCREGFISITPQTFTNGLRFSPLREVLLRGHNALDVYCFDNVPDNIFSGVKFGSGNTNKANSTRAGVIVAQKMKKTRHRITPLLRWRSHERHTMLEQAPDFLTNAAFTGEVFPKVSKELNEFYEAVQGFSHRLKDIVS
jgi:hypothetical protein